jgi:hypothetical protein
MHFPLLERLHPGLIIFRFIKGKEEEKYSQSLKYKLLLTKSRLFVASRLGVNLLQDQRKSFTDKISNISQNLRQNKGHAVKS